MTIDERTAGPVTMLDLHGRLTVEVAGLVKDKVSSLLRQGRAHLVLNLADVDYIDSTGLGELVATRASVMRQNGGMSLLQLTRRVHELMAITKLTTVFDVFDSEDEAVRSFGAPARRSA
jgi:anti-sigma B factor antagonist